MNGKTKTTRNERRVALDALGHRVEELEAELRAMWPHNRRNLPQRRAIQERIAVLGAAMRELLDD